MKYLKIITLASLAIMGLWSCTDLNVEEPDSIVLESTGGTPDPGDPVALLTGLYNDLGAFTDQANIYSLTTHTSDEMIPPTRGVDWGDNGVWRTLHAHTWDPTHSFVLNAWNQLNERIFKANQVLAGGGDAQNQADAKFLRAFLTFYVMDFYGQVPFREFGEGIDVDPVVFSRSEAFDRIVADLEDALPNLPTAGPSTGNTKANQAAANALLARLYLNKAVYTSANPAGPYTFDGGDMDKVIAYADAVTADGYSLESEFFTNFTSSAASEVIFASPDGSPQNRWMMTLHYSMNPSGWNGFTTLADFYDKFDANDSRIGIPASPDGSEFSGFGKGFLIGQQYNEDGSELIDSRSQKPLQFSRDVPLAGAATEKGIRVIKWHPKDNGPYILLRYADVFLMKAEAMMRKGDNAGALAEVNALRAVRGADALGSLDEAAMLDERGREMYWEGTRRTDQVRFGTFTSTWSEKMVTDAHRVLYPIPQQAIDSNPNLVQNDGY